MLINAKNLKGTNIIISEDLTKIELKERKVLVVALKEARNNNQNAKFRRNKIIIEGVEYTASDIEKTITDAQLFDNIPIRKVHSEPTTPSHKEFVEESDEELEEQKSEEEPRHNSDNSNQIVIQKPKGKPKKIGIIKQNSTILQKLKINSKCETPGRKLDVAPITKLSKTKK
ncbi:unnamed protein product [Psylliodes chrysocephalus]|uniref:Uncharacterized protein n=1 Tax=Psylliodes chrysocephalus TaxID=3402493 RepID=A0A9P0GEH4_9CUCU|nr:unnamed protein product [Psylliodes chrysocephala]